MPYKVIGLKSSISVFHKHYPNSQIASKLAPKVFKCIVFVHIHDINWGKLDLRALRCILVGYSSIKKRYKCYSPASRKIFICMDITVVKKIFFLFKFLSSKENMGKDKEHELFFLDLQATTQPNIIISPILPVILEQPFDQNRSTFKSSLY